MTIVRERHPFEGRTLQVIGGMRRRGIQLLLVVLPDGSRSLIPANWTDWAATRVGDQSSATSENRAEQTLGRLADLLHARTIVDALLSRHAAVPNREAAKESLIAKQKSEPVRSAPRRNLPLGNIARAVQAARDRNSGTTHR